MDAEGNPFVKLTEEEIRIFRESVRLACRVAGAFVEVGIAKATSTVILLKALGELRDSRRVYGIDQWEGPREWHERAAIAFGGSCEVKYLVGNSRTLKLDPREPIAWLFIDGSHAKTRHVMKDVNNWAPEVVPGGVLVMHDSRRATVEETIRINPIIAADFVLQAEARSWPGIAVFRRKQRWGLRP